MTLRFAAPILLAAALGLIAPPAHAAPRDEAKRYFKAGMVLIAEGQLDEGIVELERAYDILPHPNVLFNIGRAYADAGRIEDAVVFFRRYVESGPPDAADAQALIYQLEETLAEQRRAAGKVEVVIPEGEVSAEQVKALMELADRLERVAERVETGSPTGTGMGGLDLDADDLYASKSLETVYEEQVVSASRQVTSPLDAPVSTTILTAEDIRISGVTNIPDLLRQVVGMDIMQMGAANHNIAIRGFNQRMNNKVLVLVDGRSVYLDFVGTTFWRLLDVNLVDIERIEIIRGPGSTMYGANAFSGVVNIITKPKGEKSFDFGIIGGMGESIQGAVRFSDRIKTVGYALSLGYEQTDRFELEYDPERLDLIPQAADPTLAIRALRINGGINWLPRRDTTIALSGGMSHAFVDYVSIGQLRNMYGKGTFPWVRFDLRHRGISARVFWNHTSLDVGPAWLAPGSLDSITDSLANNVIDVEASYGGDVNLGIPHHITVGAGFRVKTIEWDYLDESHVERHLNGFIEDSITFFDGGQKFDSLSAVLGFRFDQHPLVGFTPSPRVAIVAKPTDSMSIRASAGTAFRIPTFMESYLAVRVASPFNGVSFIAFGDTELDPEMMRSVELGYRFEGSDYFMFDVAGYYQRVNNLIRLGPIYGTPDWGLDEKYPDQIIGGYSLFENMDQPYSGFGVEPSVHVFPVDGLDISVNYALNYLIDVDAYKAGADDPRDDRTPLHKFNVGVQYRSPFYLDFNVNMHVVGAYTVPEWTYADTGEAVPENFLNPIEVDPYVILNARIVLRLLDDRINLGVTGWNLTAFGEDGGHIEHDFGTKIGPRVYGSFSYQF